jgi:hypothetical protein
LNEIDDGVYSLVTNETLALSAYMLTVMETEEAENLDVEQGEEAPERQISSATALQVQTQRRFLRQIHQTRLLGQRGTLIHA